MHLYRMIVEHVRILQLLSVTTTITLIGTLVDVMFKQDRYITNMCVRRRFSVSFPLMVFGVPIGIRSYSTLIIKLDIIIDITYFLN